MDPHLSIEATEHGGMTQLALGGEVDLHVTSMIRDAVGEVLRDPDSTGVTIDLARVTFLDSSGISVLLTCKKLAKVADKSFAVIGARGVTAEILDLTGVAEYLGGVR